MKRRALIKTLAVGIPSAATITAGIAGLAGRSADYVKETSEHSMEALRKNLDDLRRRIEHVDAKNRKLVRAALALSALSLGLDVTMLL